MQVREQGWLVTQPAGLGQALDEEALAEMTGGLEPPEAPVVRRDEGPQRVAQVGGGEVAAVDGGLVQQGQDTAALQGGRVRGGHAGRRVRGAAGGLGVEVGDLVPGAGHAVAELVVEQVEAVAAPVPAVEEEDILVAAEGADPGGQVGAEGEPGAVGGADQDQGRGVLGVGRAGRGGHGAVVGDQAGGAHEGQSPPLSPGPSPAGGGEEERPAIWRVRPCQGARSAAQARPRARGGWGRRPRACWRRGSSPPRRAWRSRSASSVSS